MTACILTIWAWEENGWLSPLSPWVRFACKCTCVNCKFDEWSEHSGSACTSSIYSMTYNQLLEEFNCSHEIATLGLSLFIWGMGRPWFGFHFFWGGGGISTWLSTNLGVGPLVLAPLSEVRLEVWMAVCRRLTYEARSMAEESSTYGHSPFSASGFYHAQSQRTYRHYLSVDLSMDSRVAHSWALREALLGTYFLVIVWLFPWWFILLVLSLDQRLGLCKLIGIVS